MPRSGTPRWPGQHGAWGVGPENLAPFHETSGAEERGEREAVRAQQRERWAAGFGWLTGPVAHGGAGLPAGCSRPSSRCRT
ncbi:MAG TPA: hypothetical protein VK659_25765 [Asanoa sp.]|nr:hypothetical protein [Asanoa sp.]